MAAATNRIRLTTSMANNLVRSPVEAAQLALTLHDEGDGRFDLGIGAGWERAEIESIGFDYPTAPVRARRYVAAIEIIRDLFTTGRATADNEHYTVGVDFGASRQPPPALIGAVAGPWTIRHVTPLVDRVELLPFARSSAVGAFQADEVGSLDRNTLRVKLDEVRAVAADTPVSLLLFVVAGRREHTTPFQQVFNGTLGNGLCGEPARVADTLLSVGELGIDHVSIIPLTPNGEPDLAAALEL